MRFLLTVLSALICISAPIHAEVFAVQDSKRLVEVIDVVDGSMIKDVAQKIDALSQASSKPIDMFINSPGGAVLVGTTIIDSMLVARSRGVKFRCISSVLAASMAFIILAHCDERYVLPNTKLLFHPVSTSSSGRIQELLISLDQIKDTEMAIMKFINDKMKLPWKKFHMHYFAETMWSGASLDKHTDHKFLKVVTSVKGIPNLFQIQKEKPAFFQLQLKGDYEQAERILRKAGLSIGREIKPEVSEEQIEDEE
jgi:ATP-dependent protease ClpP protease subunit